MESTLKNYALKDYAGFWVALTEQNTVGGVGRTVSDAVHAARIAWPKERLRLALISVYPPYVPLPAWPLKPLRDLVADARLWLVGGAVRDLLLGREPDDWDFTVMGNAVRLARKVADHMQGNFYVLDAERGTGRAIITPPHVSHPVHLDFAQVRGASIEKDLYARDFTINAIAMTVDGQVFDPTDGIRDLKQGRLAVVRHDALTNDPIRLLRAIRLAYQFELSLEPWTADAIHRLASTITSVAGERIQTELTKLLKVPAADQALVALRERELLPHLLPEVADLTTGPWKCTLRVLQALSWLTSLLHQRSRDNQPPHTKQTSGVPDWVVEDIRHSVGDLLSPLINYLDEEINRGLSRDHLLRWAGLFHAIGQPSQAAALRTDTECSDRERKGSIVVSRCRALRLPNDASDLIKSVVSHQCTPADLIRIADSRRMIYRYFQETNGHGLAVIWFSLARSLAVFSLNPDRASWHRLLKAVRTLLSAYFRRYEAIIAPEPLLSGSDLIRLGLKPGPRLGAALRWLLESQASGKIRNRDHAITEISRRYLSPSAIEDESG